MIIVKNERAIEAMREAGGIACSVLNDVCQAIVPGQTTKDIEAFAADRISSYGARSAFLGYKKYPCHVCLSVNDEVVHGIAGSRRLNLGDLVSVDVGVIFRGYVGDTAKTVAVGGCGVQEQRLIEVTEEALNLGIAQAVAGNRVVDISRAIQRHVENRGFSIVREFVGHGVGRTIHEEPQVPNYVDGRSSPRLRAGMTLAIEPMVNAGGPEIQIQNDGWTVTTRDGKPSAHFEHSVLVTDSVPEILTAPRAPRVQRSAMLG